MMIIVRYAENGQAVSDAGVDAFVDRLISLNNQTGRAYADIGNFLVVDAVRAAIVEGKIDHKEVSIKFNEDTVEFDQYAHPLNKWPADFVDPTAKYIRNLIQARANKYKSEKAL